MFIKATVDLGFRTVEATGVIIGPVANHIMDAVHIRHPHGRHDIQVTPAEYQQVSQALFQAAQECAA